MITLNQPCGLVCQGLLSDMTEKDDDFRFYCGAANQILESKESVKGAIVDFFSLFLLVQITLKIKTTMRTTD